MSRTLGGEGKGLFIGVVVEGGGRGKVRMGCRGVCVWGGEGHSGYVV